jgi:hypothetical protein
MFMSMSVVRFPVGVSVPVNVRVLVPVIAFSVHCTLNTASNYGNPEPEFLNIYWRLKCRLFEKAILSKVKEYNRAQVDLVFCEYTYFNNYFV